MTWPMARLRYLAQINPPVRKALADSPEQEVVFFPMEAVGETGSLDPSRTRPVGELLAGYTPFENGDVIFAKVTPCFENGKGALVRDLSQGVGFGSTEFTVLRPKEHVDPRFLEYILRSAAFRQHGAGAMTGAGGLKRVPDDFVRDFQTPLPSRQEQTRVANFLDEQTARIDALIASSESARTILTEYRDARISQATRDRECDQSRRIGLAVTGHYGGVWGDEPDGENDLAVVRVADFDREACRVALGEQPTIRAIAPSHRGARMLQRGDLLIEKSGGGELQPVGNVVMFDADTRAVCSNFVARLAVSPQCDPRYVAFAFRGLYVSRKNMAHIKQTSGIQNIDVQSYLGERVFLPPRAEQARIADELSGMALSVDGLGRAKAALVEKLRDYRASLISAAVTGRQDLGASGCDESSAALPTRNSPP